MSNYKQLIMTGFDDFRKYSFFPIEHDNLLKYYRLQFDMIWTAQEIDMSQDRHDWTTLDPKTQRLIKFVLCFFSQADGLVIENISKRFQDESSDLLKEAGHFYAVQNLVETVHNEMYSIMIDVFITDPTERARALNAIQHYPEIRDIALWMKKWMESDRPLRERIIAFACIEGIIFVALFVAIWYIKRQNKLPGLCKANEFIARDEALHALFAIELYHTLKLKETDWPEKTEEEKTVVDIVKEAVGIAENLIKKSLENDLIGLKTDDLVEYVHMTADNLVTQLGFNPIFRASNPFEWMVAIGIPNRTNFFEQRVSEYSKLGSKSTLEFDTTAEF